MKRGIFLICLAFFLILGSLYGLWKLDQPRVGPIGSGTYRNTTYIPFILNIITGIHSLILGIVIIVKRKEWSKYQDKYLRKAQLKERYVPLLIFSGVLYLFTIIFIVFIGLTFSGVKHSYSGPLIGVFGFGTIFIFILARFLYFLNSKKEEE